MSAVNNMDPMGISEFSTIIGTVGFPIVAFFLMFTRMEKALEKMEQAINNNTLLVKILMEREGVKNDNSN